MDDEVQVCERVRAGIDDLIVELGRAYREAVPEYAALGDVEMDTEVLPVSRDLVVTFLDALTAGRTPDVAGRKLTSMGARRLAMGVPLEPMLHVYRVAGRVVWDAIVASTKPEETGALAGLGAAWMDYLDRASSVAATGYLDASHERLRRLDADRDALVEALLAAADEAEVGAVAIAYQTAFAPAYVPVVFDGNGVAARIDRVLDAAPPGTLGRVRGTTVLALVPAGPEDASRPVPTVEAAAAEVTVVGEPAAAGRSLAAEVAELRQLLAAAQASGRTGRLTTRDLAVERLVAGAPKLAASLRSTVVAPLAALDRNRTLHETLAAFVELGAVPEVARAVQVHPNTVAYRLRRIHEITGLDPKVPRHLLLLVVAMATTPAPEL
jgi:hypothetical protein